MGYIPVGEVILFFSRVTPPRLSGIDHILQLEGKIDKNNNNENKLYKQTKTHLQLFSDLKLHESWFQFLFLWCLLPRRGNNDIYRKF